MNRDTDECPTLFVGHVSSGNKGELFFILRNGSSRKKPALSDNRPSWSVINYVQRFRATAGVASQREANFSRRICLLSPFRRYAYHHQRRLVPVPSRHDHRVTRYGACTRLKRTAWTYIIVWRRRTNRAVYQGHETAKKKRAQKKKIIKPRRECSPFIAETGCRQR